MHRNLLRRFMSLAVLGMTATFIQAQEKVGPAAKYSAILKDYEKASSVYVMRLQKAGNVAEQGQIFREQNPQPAAARKMLELATAHPKDPVAYECLTWIVQNSEFGPAAEKPYAEAVHLLATRYADHKDNEKLLERMASSPFASSSEFLKAVSKKHPSPIVRGRAAFYWGLHLKNYCGTVERLHKEPEFARNVELFIGADLANRLKDADTAKLLREAEDVFARVEKDYPLVGYKKTNLGKAAAAELFELRNLAIGKVVPEIEADDTEGKKFKLSDYRGKVVVLVFWGTWCPHCMAMVPTERALVKRYEGQPFAMVGVNSDIELDKLKPALVKHSITWRSFYDGPTITGPIATQWNVIGWPAVYVLDAKGIIRYRGVRGEQLEQAVGELMKK
jgi:thiol-disulfide isomerase/thioredoxin